MNVWFTRSNGNAGHNNPSLGRYIPGEPPRYPETAFNYGRTCLERGFARIGWPGTGDLRSPGWIACGRSVYSAEEFKEIHVGYLEAFSGIATGDLVVIPADRDEDDVHLGRVVLRDVTTREVIEGRAGLAAYYHHFDVARGDWYENSHRVDVLWDSDEGDEFRIHHIPALGGIWYRAFSAVRQANEEIVGLAGKNGLLQTKR